MKLKERKMKAMRLMIVVLLLAAPCRLIGASGSFDIAQILLNDLYKGKDMAESIGSLWDHPDQSIVKWHWQTKVQALKELRQALAEYAMANNKYDVPLNSYGNYLLHFLAEDFDVLKTIWEKGDNEAKLKPTLNHLNSASKPLGGPKTPLDVALKEYNAKAVEFLIDKGADLGDVNDKVVKVLDVGIHEFMWNSDPVKMLAVKETLVVLLRRGADVDNVKQKLAADTNVWWYQDPTHKAKAEEVLDEAKALAAAGSGHGGGGGSGPSSGSGSTTPLDDLKTALEALKAKLAALATVLKK